MLLVLGARDRLSQRRARAPAWSQRFAVLSGMAVVGALPVCPHSFTSRAGPLPAV